MWLQQLADEPGEPSMPFLTKGEARTEDSKPLNGTAALPGATST